MNVFFARKYKAEKYKKNEDKFKEIKTNKRIVAIVARIQKLLQLLPKYKKMLQSLPKYKKVVAIPFKIQKKL